MANAQSANTIFIDSASDQVSDKRNIKIAYILLTTSGAGDSIELRESASGPTKLLLKHATANDTAVYRLHGENALFSEGIYVYSISSGAVATLIVKGP